MPARLPPPELLRHDRIAARAAWQVRVGQLDARDLRQVLPRRGSWLLGTKFAAGKFTAIHAAVHTHYGWQAAVKLGDVAHEAAVLAGLHHANIVRLWDAGDDYLVLSRARGGSLRDVLRRRGRLPQRTVIRIAFHLAKALHALDRQELIHGDLKPGNVLVHRGAVWLADFGLARRRDDRAVRDEVRGSWGYLAPECFHGEHGPRADLYALGLTLHELASGVPAVSATTFRDARSAHHALNLEPLHWTIPGIGRDLSDVILRLAARHPEDRPADARTLLDTLQTLEPTP
jgi:eukaryotic-like serine/threonine-protein kinase